MRKVLVALLLVPLGACAGGVPDRPKVVSKIEPPVVAAPVLPGGYAAEAVTERLVDPRAVAFDESGRPHVLEGSAARLSRLDGGRLMPVAVGGGNGPWTGLARLGDVFYVAEAGGPLGGRVLRVAPDGGVAPVAADLPVGGVLGPLAAGPDGRLYLGVATARAGEGANARDIPCQDLRLQGGRRVEGEVPCTGAVLRIDPADGMTEVHSWGFADPVGLAFTADGRLLVADDLPLQGGVMWAAVPGVWYGWPDYLGQVASADPQLAVHPNPPPPPVATLGADLGGVAVPESSDFGGGALVFVAQDDGTIAFAAVDSGVTAPFAANLARPAALAFSPLDGALWVADAGTGVLWRVAALGPGKAST